MFNTTPSFPLADASGAAIAKWSARIGSNRYAAATITNAAYNLLHVTWTFTAPEAGANEVVYTNAPSDISDTLGRELGAFTFSP